MINKIIAITDSSVSIPIWVTVVVTIIAAIGTFWSKLAPYLTSLDENKTAIEKEKIAVDELEKSELKERIKELEIREDEAQKRIVRHETALRVIVPIMKEIMKHEPTYHIYITTLENLLNETDAESNN